MYRHPKNATCLRSIDVKIVFLVFFKSRQVFFYFLEVFVFTFLLWKMVYTLGLFYLKGAHKLPQNKSRPNVRLTLHQRYSVNVFILTLNQRLHTNVVSITPQTFHQR